MINRLIDYVRKVYLEMRKVTWPTRGELVNSTIVVIVISVLVAVLVFILDTIFAGGLGLVVK